MSDLNARQELARRLRSFRESAKLAPEDVEERLILGPGWVAYFESPEGFSRLGVSTLMALLDVLGVTVGDLFAGIAATNTPGTFRRALYVEPSNDGIDVHFEYGRFDATHHLGSATVEEFESVVKTLRDGLARLPPAAGSASNSDDGRVTAIKSTAVEQAFWKAMTAWPHANPADLWGFVVGRAYADPFNHPATSARGDLGQSWKRTGGWALERIVVNHYSAYLLDHGIRLEIPAPARKLELLRDVQARVSVRLEADKVDVLITGVRDGKEICFGVVHVKNSFAERRTDDVDMSRALVQAGYASPLWTMDCKSWPGERPIHAGELGNPLPARRSAKRVDIEDDQYFSTCFSYNRNTLPTPAGSRTKGAIVICNFSDPDDAFSQFLIQHWGRFS